MLNVAMPRGGELSSFKGRTIRYLRGGGGGGCGQIPKKNSRTEKIQKKNIVHNKPIEKKNRARTRGDF